MKELMEREYGLAPIITDLNKRKLRSIASSPYKSVIALLSPRRDYRKDFQIFVF